MNALVEAGVRRPRWCRVPMLLHLFHGRPLGVNPDGWGADGPVLVIHGFHVTYQNHMRVGVNDDSLDWFDIEFLDGCLYYDGVYYGDWSIFAYGTDDDLGNRRQYFRTDLARIPEADKRKMCEHKERTDTFPSFCVHCNALIPTIEPGDTQ